MASHLKSYLDKHALPHPSPPDSETKKRSGSATIAPIIIAGSFGSIRLIGHIRPYCDLQDLLDTSGHFYCTKPRRCWKQEINGLFKCMLRYTYWSYIQTLHPRSVQFGCALGSVNLQVGTDKQSCSQLRARFCEVYDTYCLGSDAPADLVQRYLHIVWVVGSQ